MFLLQNDLPLNNLDAAGQAMGLRVLVPLVEHIQFLGRGRTQVFLTADNPRDTRAAGAVKTTRLHLDTGFLTGIQKLCTCRDFGGNIGWENGDLWHVRARPGIAGRIFES